MKYIFEDGKKMNFEMTGKGPAVVLIHGWCNNWMGWIPLIKKLKNNFTVYAIDQMGFGRSSRLSSYSIASQTDYLACFIKGRRIKPVLVCGLSMGTFIVTDFGLRYPGLAKKLVLMSAVFPKGKFRNLTKILLRKSLVAVSGGKIKERLVKRFIIDAKTTAYTVAKYLNMYRFNRFLIDNYSLPGRKEMDEKAFIQMGISVSDYPLDKKVNLLKQPTLLLYGSYDKFTNISQAKLVVRGKNFFWAEIPQAGHVVSLEQPCLVARALLDFAKSEK